MNNLPRADTLPIITTYYANSGNPVHVINATSIIDRIFTPGVKWNDACDIFNEWCAQHNVEYYGRPNDEYNPIQAVGLAINNGNHYIILDNLS